MTIAERLERLWSTKLGYVLVAIGTLSVLGIWSRRQTYPNYDTFYTLLWGQELANGHLPDYGVFRPPTPHPLATFVGWLAAPFGTSSDRLIILASLLLFLGLLIIVFRFTQRLLGSFVALIAVVVLLTRTDLDLLALRGMFDLPFYVLVFGAAALELRRPRIGWPVLLLFAIAGLLRPEAWLLAGVYWLYLIPGTPRAVLARYLLLVLAAPLIWLACDWIVQGQPLYSLTETRDVAGQFGRNRGLIAAIKLIPDNVSGNDKVVTDGVGGMGLVLAILLLRRRAWLPVALGGLGVLTFLLIAAAGLSVIPRYLTIPSMLLSLSVAVALGGWTVARERWLRNVAVGVAVLSVALIVWRVPAYHRDVSTLNAQAGFVAEQHHDLLDVLDDPRVVPLMQTCWPIVTPTHSAIPVIRYQTGLPKQAVVASIQQHKPPAHGLLLISRTFQFEPKVARKSIGTGGSASAKWWSNVVLPGYEKVAQVGRWAAYANCTQTGTSGP
ncbi:MAG: hypothetical protein JWP17_405 [Solirubrobacterales bacterium]|nr:hypothetical protein [Solirubrobacterales bacterium]